MALGRVKDHSSLIWVLAATMAAAALVSVKGAGPARAASWQDEIQMPADFPISLVWGPDSTLYFTLRGGDVKSLKPGGSAAAEVLHVDVTTAGETGLLGLEIAPDFAASPFLYFFFTSPDRGNLVARSRITAGRGSAPEIILSGLASALYHNGGILKFAPDGTLFVSTGEAHDANRAQDPGDIGGKILRINPDGTVPKGNPFGAGSKVFALGVRNAFGLAIDPVTKDLWETENGPTGNDEVNRIVAGGNYGWPRVQCSDHLAGYIDAAHCFRQTVVPTQAAFLPLRPPEGRAWIDPSLAGNLFLGAYHGQIYRAVLGGDRKGIASVEVFHDAGAGVVGVFAGPDGNLWFTTPQGIHRLMLTRPAAPVKASPASSPSPGPSPAAPSPSPPARPGHRGLGWVLGGVLLALAVAVAAAAGIRRPR